jgi:hypothetical protein
MRTAFKLHGLARKMVARHGVAARDVAYAHARLCRQRGSDRQAGMWLEVIRLIAELSMGDGKVQPIDVIPFRRVRSSGALYRAWFM